MFPGVGQMFILWCR